MIRRGQKRFSQLLARSLVLFAMLAGLAPASFAQMADSSYFGDGFLYHSNVSGFARPEMPQRGSWGEIIMVNAKWIVIQNQQGQQFPVAMDSVGSFMTRWPTSADALTRASMIEVTGSDVASNQIMTDHVDVFEGPARNMVTPTTEINQGFSLVLSPVGLGRSSISGPNNPGMAGIWGAPNIPTFVGSVVDSDPLQFSIGGNQVWTVVPGNNGITMTQVTLGTWSTIRKGDVVYFVPSSAGARSLVLGRMVLYKSIPFARFAN
ncbi:hypothetical protein EP7_004012 [Isosphaeraceae bacterium EP7]